jgi:hypothetical protein
MLLPALLPMLLPVHRPVPKQQQRAMSLPTAQSPEGAPGRCKMQLALSRNDLT